MRRLARWTLNALTAISLLVCVGTVALWPRSYFVTQYLDYHYGPSSHPRQRYTGVASCRGSYLLETFWRRLTPDAAWGKGVGSTGFTYIRRVPARQWGGATVFVGEVFNEHLRPDADGYAGTVGFHVVIPQWSVALATAALPTWWTLDFRRRRMRSRPGLCPGCGYDMRATPAQCPECGRAGEVQAGVGGFR